MKWKTILALVAILVAIRGYAYLNKTTAAPRHDDQSAASQPPAESVNRKERVRSQVVASSQLAAVDRAFVPNGSAIPGHDGEVAHLQAMTMANLIREVRKGDFRQRAPETQMIIKELLSRYLAKADNRDLDQLAAVITAGNAVEADDIFDVVTMSTSAGAASILVALAFSSEQDDIRKKALGEISHLYKARGHDRASEDMVKIEQQLLTVLTRPDLSDHEFAAVAQGLAGFGSAYGTQALIDLWPRVLANRQEMIGRVIANIYQQTALEPLGGCVREHKHLWKACGLSLAMLGSNESITGILEAVAGSQEKKAESLSWFQSVNKIAAINLLLVASKERADEDRHYFSRVRVLAEGLLANLYPSQVQ